MTKYYSSKKYPKKIKQMSKLAKMMCILLRDWSKSIGGGGWARAERGWVISF